MKKNILISIQKVSKQSKEYRINKSPVILNKTSKIKFLTQVKEAENEDINDWDNFSSHSGSSALLMANQPNNHRLSLLKKNMISSLRKNLSKKVYFLRSQEQEYMALSKKVSKGTGSASDFDFMVRDQQDFNVGSDWDLARPGQASVILDISQQEDSEDLKGILKKISRLTKLLTNINEVKFSINKLVLEKFLSLNITK